MTRRQWAFDATVAVVVFVLTQVEVWNGAGATHRQGPTWAQATVYAVGAGCLLFRRVRPLEGLAALTGAYILEFVVIGSPEGFGVQVPVSVAAYSVARWETRHRTWWGLVATGVFGLAWLTFDPMSRTWSDRLAASGWAATLLIAWLVGALVRSRMQNAEQRRLARQEQASRAVAEERNRIARELHDVIGHSVSVMTVQAAAVRRRLTPEQAVEREALESVESVGREALTEMRRMVGVLRQGEEAGNREPPPSLANLSGLVGKFRAAGLPVDLLVTGTPRPLASGLDLTAYRLLQEGLTNALRHAQFPTYAQVSVAYADDVLELAVRDDGRTGAEAGEPGHGLLGMRERVGVYGGQLWARHRPEGGFELVARLPAVTE